jgi:adenosylhomocysteinase
MTATDLLTSDVLAPSTVPALPVLQETIAASPPAACRLTLVAHALDTAGPYVRALAAAMDVTALVPVPYSARASALAALPGIRVELPERIDQVGRLAADIALDQTATAGSPVVVQEVGGYCASQVDRLAAGGVRGVVEDTKQGQWRYEEISRLPLPVFTIADSPLKALEDFQVGRAVATSVERLLRRDFYTMLAERRVLVLGYGGIGTALADHVRRTGAVVAVHDPDEVRMSAAVVHGHRVGERADLLGWAEVIIGVSGHRALDVTDLALLRDGVILASGSSKQVEFDVQGLRRVADESWDAPDRETHLVDGRLVHLLNEGKPVNFLEQSVLGSILDLVYSELYLCTRELAMTQHPAGMHRLHPEQQMRLARRWREHYGRA